MRDTALQDMVFTKEKDARAAVFDVQVCLRALHTNGMHCTITIAAVLVRVMLLFLCA